MPPFLTLKVMKKQFYEKVLPGQGVYCAASINNGKVTHHFADSIDDLMAIVDRLKEEKTNVFVALNSFDGHSRKADHAAYARSFFIDLDVGDDPKKYPSKDDALAELVAFVEEIGLPIPIVIDSGNGVHAYWVLDEDVPSNVWKKYAEKFKAFMLTGLKIDPAVTADCSRILRCPDTFNYKSDPPIPTKFLTDDFTQYSLSVFTDIMGEVDAPENALDSILKDAQKGLDDDTLSVSRNENYEVLFSNIAYYSVNDKGCRQIKYCLENQATLAEPLWHSGLSIARHCDDWETAIHEFSEGHPTYNREETIRKANETLDKPHGCEVFESRNPNGCDGCPFKGKISNPLYFGRQLKEADESEEDIEAQSVRLDEDTEEVPVYTKFPQDVRPYKRGINGGIYLSLSSKKDDAPPQDVELWKNDVYPIKRIYHPDQGEYLLWRHFLPHDPPRDILLSMAQCHSADKISEAFSKEGVFIKKSYANHFVDYVITWGTYMLHKGSAELMRRQMGWHDKDNSFVAGVNEYHRSGRVTKTAASALINTLSKIIFKSGSYDEWKRGAALINTPGLEQFALPTLCGFGSPLMRLTPHQGVSVCYTGTTGIGKSGSLYCASSIWGAAKEMCLSGNKKASGTENALIQWMVSHKNIMLGLDEASNRQPEELSDLIHKVSDGKTKLRLNSSSDTFRTIEATTALICFMTSNQSLTDKLLSIKTLPDGELARLIEITYVKPKPFVNDPSLPVKIIEPMRRNHGHAGPEYIEYLFKIGEVEVAKRVDKWKERFKLEFSSDIEYRYYEALISTAFAGGELAIEAGIIDWDLERIYKSTMDRLVELRDGATKINKADYETMLGEFQNQHLSGTLIVRTDGMIEEPRAPLVARIDVGERIYYVSTKVFRDHLRKLQINKEPFIEHMTAKGILVYQGKKRLTDGWGGRNSTSPISLYGFKYAVPEELLAKNGT